MAYSLTGKPAALAGLGKICLSPDLYQGLSPLAMDRRPFGAGSGNTPAQSNLSQYGGILTRFLSSFEVELLAAHLKPGGQWRLCVK